MGIFSNSTPFDGDVEKITDEKNTSEDWGMIMDLCDRVQATSNGSRDCLKSITKRLQHQDPHVVMQAITLLDACVNNCGKPFKLEVASREFESEFKKLLSKWPHQKVQDKLKSMLKKWADNDFKGEPQFALIPALYNGLKKEGIDFSGSAEPGRRKGGGHTNSSSSSSASKNPNVVSSQQEEDDIAKAIQLSLAESKVPSSQKARSSSSSSHSVQQHLYPTAQEFIASTAATPYQPSASVVASGSLPSTTQLQQQEQKKARALYDFEAAEDNELTFKTGEIVIIIDDSDQNWWKGSNHRGEGLFPANFVTTDLNAGVEDDSAKAKKTGSSETTRRRSVQFNEEVEVKTVDSTQPVCLEISEDKIDKVLNMLNEADPTAPESGDPPELAGAEEGVVNAMGPLIDTELERIDRRHAQLTRISTELVDALNLYHQLMHEVPPQAQAAAAAAAAAAPSAAQFQYPSYPQAMMPPQQQMYGGVYGGEPAAAASGQMTSNGVGGGIAPPPMAGYPAGAGGSPHHNPHHPYQPPQQQHQQHQAPPPPMPEAYPPAVVSTTSTTTAADQMSNGGQMQGSAAVYSAPMTSQHNPQHFTQAPHIQPPPPPQQQQQQQPQQPQQPPQPTNHASFVMNGATPPAALAAAAAPGASSIPQVQHPPMTSYQQVPPMN